MPDPYVQDPQYGGGFPPQVRRRGPALAPLLLLVLAGGLVGVYWLNHSRTRPLNDLNASPHPVAPRGKLSDLERTTISIFQKAAPSVVHITNLRVARILFSRRILEIPQGTGSGFIWDPRGYVVTNFHVVQGGNRFRVVLADRSRYPARLVGGSPRHDLAVLLIDPGSKKLAPLPIGRSQGLLVGQTVLAIGNPFGLDQTLTTGVISGLGREIQSPSKWPIKGVIQTDAAINPGNSGGPLLDSSGRLIGINTAIYSPSGANAGSVGIGFAVPVDTVNRVVPLIIRNGDTRSASLGIVPIDEDLARANHIDGVMISQVVPRGPADRAGLRGVQHRGHTDYYGDIIKSLNDQPVHDWRDLKKILRTLHAAQRVHLTYERGGRLYELSLLLGAE